MQVTQENELVEGLRSMVALYLSKNSQLTLNALAGRSSVPVTTLRRLMNGEQKSEIAPHSVLNLVSYLLREKKLSALLERVEPSIAEFLKKHFGHFIFASGDRVYRTDLNRELQDQTKYFIYKLAANHDGTDWFAITENFGSHGKKKAEDMLANGLLEACDDRIHARDKNFSLDVTVAAAHLPALAGFYRPESMAQGLNSFFSLSEALTKEAVQEIRAIQRQCVQKIHAVMSEPTNLGDIPYFTLNLAETFLTDQSVQGEIQ